jgi:hypothetical protein
LGFEHGDALRLREEGGVVRLSPAEIGWQKIAQGAKAEQPQAKTKPAAASSDSLAAADFRLLLPAELREQPPPRTG